MDADADADADAAARARLGAEKDRVEGLIASVQRELDEETASDAAELAHYDQHPADTGTDTFEREKDLSVLDTLENRLAEIEAALQRVDDGTYGLDDATGEKIARERLDAEPTARHNVVAGVPAVASDPGSGAEAPPPRP